MDNLYREVVALQNAFRNHIDQPNSPAGKKLANEIQALENDVQMQKNPRSIENRTKQIIRMLDAMSSDIMDDRDIDDIKVRAEAIRDKTRKM